MLIIHPPPRFSVEEVSGKFTVAPPVGALIMGAVVYLLNLPFLILAFNSPFYRQRFEALFGIEVVHRQDLERGDPSEPKEIG